MSTSQISASNFPALKRNLRRAPRTDINMHLKVVRTVAGVKKLVPGYARNISEGGMGVFVPAQLALDERVEVTFTLPGIDKELTVNAIVRTIEKFQYGLEFTRLDEVARGILVGHCRIQTSAPN